ncbi:esterase family protein [Pontibacter harenae]|uniref:esterase family protein n=1 Tax=Pontibacter harenae TaxID=2894083 RepID=UPI001E39437D|nr:alpha/beta hydrolase-fold protein [Pontibacter harenae]MCC9167918.1 esterase [Pontibacter harenae]
MNREYHKWYSPSLQRDMELLVFGHAGAAVLFFPARMGRFYDYENWRVIEAIRDKIEQGHLQVFCVDSVDTESFYCEGCHPSARVARYLQYEQYILTEVLPLIRQKNPGGAMVSAGCSLGAFHAVNFALKHPRFFCKVVGMSGRYDLSQQMSHYRDLLQGHWSEGVYFNMPNQYVPSIDGLELLDSLRRLEITLAVGQDDPFLGSTSYLSRALHGKGVHNTLHVWHGEAHRPRYWRKMVALYL